MEDGIQLLLASGNIEFKYLFPHDLLCLYLWMCCKKPEGEGHAGGSRVVTLKHEGVHLLPYVGVREQGAAFTGLQQQVQEGKAPLQSNSLNISSTSLHIDIECIFIIIFSRPWQSQWLL